MTDKQQREDIAVCDNCRLQLNRIKNLEGLTEKHFQILETPRKIFKMSYPVRMDNGETKIVTGLRVQFNDALGPTKGGIRFHQTVDEQEVSELAFLMSLKTSLLKLPYGGAKGGVKINPKKLSKGELERVARGYVREMHLHLGPHIDIPAPDVNTNPQVMAWMVDEYEKISGHKAPGSFTGKPLELGGSLGRDESTARGLFYILEEKYSDRDKSEISVAIQGFGNAGSHLAGMLSEIGFKIVTVSDSSTAVFDSRGLNIPELINFKKENSLKDIEGLEKISNEELLELDVELLIPAALGGVIHNDNVKNIKAQVIAELANAPITPAADEELNEKGVKIIPDILSNAGGVVVSYFEWIQNNSGDYWTKEEVFDRLKKRMTTSYHEVIKEQQNTQRSVRTSAYKVAVKRILDAEQLRGTL